MVDAKRNLAASVRQRLKNIAQERGQDFGGMLVNYGLERLIYRLSISAHRDNFILKGGMLIAAWAINDSRNTRDADFLGFGQLDEAYLKAIFAEILDVDAGDGLLYDTRKLTASTIREGQIYGGFRLRTTAYLGSVKIPITIDVGMGDANTKPDYLINYPSLLDKTIKNVRAYSPETVIAEKFQAIVALGLVNGRMKDYYDLWVIPSVMSIDEAVLDSAIGATFKRRKTNVPTARPPGLAPEFFADPAKIDQWRAYANSIDLADITLSQITGDIWRLVSPSCKRLIKSSRNI